MNVYGLILLIVLCLSLFSAALIIAACVTSSRSQQMVARHSARFVADKSFESIASDLHKQPMASRNPLASSR